METHRLLLLDTSAATIGAVAAAGGAVCGVRTHDGEREGAAVLPAMIEDALADAGWGFSDLTGIGVVAGPGSYTGLRIGMSAAKGLCYALDVPLLLHDRLGVLIAGASGEKKNAEKNIAAILPARAGEYFAALRTASGAYVFEPQHLTEDALHGTLSAVTGKLLILGPAAIHGIFSVEAEYVEAVSPSAATLALDAEVAAREGRWVPVHSAQPLYLKAAFTTIPKNGRRLAS